MSSQVIGAQVMWSVTIYLVAVGVWLAAISIAYQAPIPDEVVLWWTGFMATVATGAAVVMPGVQAARRMPVRSLARVSSTAGSLALAAVLVAWVAQWMLYAMAGPGAVTATATGMAGALLAAMAGLVVVDQRIRRAQAAPAASPASR